LAAEPFGIQGISFDSRGLFTTITGVANYSRFG
jgi:hypothetical protein